MAQNLVDREFSFSGRRRYNSWRVLLTCFAGTCRELNDWHGWKALNCSLLSAFEGEYACLDSG
jgi:hypothetical protein